MELEWKENFRMRVSRWNACKDGVKKERDLPRVIIDDIKTPFQCKNQILQLYGGCCPENPYLYFPTEIGKVTKMECKGKKCACILYIEIYIKK